MLQTVSQQFYHTAAGCRAWRVQWPRCFAPGRTTLAYWRPPATAYSHSSSSTACSRAASSSASFSRSAHVAPAPRRLALPTTPVPHIGARTASYPPPRYDTAAPSLQRVRCQQRAKKGDTRDAHSQRSLPAQEVETVGRRDLFWSLSWQTRGGGGGHGHCATDIGCGGASATNLPDIVSGIMGGLWDWGDAVVTAAGARIAR